MEYLNLVSRETIANHFSSKIIVYIRFCVNMLLSLCMHT